MTPEDLGFDSDRLDRIGALGRSYVDRGKLPCAVVQVARKGQVVYHDQYGSADVEAGRPISDDSIFRIYSMTKPITSVGLMQLYEQGRVLLEHPIAKFLPEFADMSVWAGGSTQKPQTRPAGRDITVRDVLTHTSGLTYGFHHQHPVDAIYRRNKLGDFSRPDYDLATGIERLAGLPLLFEPGSAWNYGMSTDVCGRLIEVISGQALDHYLDEHVCAPLGMADTAFSVDTTDLARMTANYMPTADGMTMLDKAEGTSYRHRPDFLGGGGGLVSTLADYQRFCDMLLAGGTLDGTRVIGRKTLEYMTRNHLPGGSLLNDLGQSTFTESVMEGTGFGLGFSVVVDPAASGAVTSPGVYGWGGAASTAFWVDPVEELTVIFLTQLLPSNTYPIRRQLQAAVYQALR